MLQNLGMTHTHTHTHTHTQDDYRIKRLKVKEMGTPKGVTMISLIVTIIVLLLLAGVTLSVLFGENGLISRTKQAKGEYEKSALNEAKFINYIQNYVIGIGTGSSGNEAIHNNTINNSTTNESGSGGVVNPDIKIDYFPQTPRNTTEGEAINGVARGPITVILKYGNTNFINSSRYQFKIGEGLWQNAAQTYILNVTENTTISARYFDGVSGYKETKIAISNVDNEAPNQFEPNQIESTTKSITIQGTTTDKSGVRGYCFSIDDGANWTEEKVENKYVFENLKTGSYYIRMKAIDKAGNERITEPIRATTIPVPSAKGNVESLQEWQYGNCLLTLKQKINEFTMQYKIGEGEWKNYTGIITTKLNDIISIRYSDGINTGEEDSIQIKDEIRPISPDIKIIEGTQGLNNWYTSDILLEITSGTDKESGIDRTTYQINGSQAIEENNIPTNGRITIKTDGINTITCYTYDKAGNRSPTTTITLKKDSVSPSIPTIASRIQNEQGNSYVSDTWTNQGIIVDIQSTDINQIQKYEWKEENGKWKETEPIAELRTATIKFTNTQNNTIFFRTMDEAGNYSGESSIILKIDKEDPKVTTSKQVAGKKESVTITINAIDNESGIKQIQKPDGTKVETNTTTYVVQENGNYTFTIEDNAGNSILKMVEVTEIDKEAPTFTSAEIKNISITGYDVYVYGVTDITGVDRLQFPTWTEYNGQDDIEKSWQTSTAVKGQNQGNGTWYFRVNTTKHNNEFGVYHTHIYAYDTLGNSNIIKVFDNIKVPGVILFNSNGGFCDTVSKEIHYGEKYGELPVANKTGYGFQGWYTAENKKIESTTIVDIVNPITLYAKWAANTYTVVYNGNGATGGTTANSIHTYDVAKPLTTNGFSKTGYTFAGWNTKADGTGTNYTNGQSVTNLATNGTVTIYAKWAINSYTLTVNPGGTTSKQNYGTTKTVTAPTSNYTVNYNGNGGSTPEAQISNRAFTSWTLNGAGTLSSSTTNPTIYTYGAGDGTLTANYNATGTAITLPTPTRIGYTFNGWYTASTGGTKVGNAGSSYSPTANITLYAQWTINTYTITYNLDGGTVGTANPTSYNIETETITLNNPTKTGYTFTGWSGSNGTTAQTNVSITKGSTGNKAYTANWKINSYTLTINPGGGTWGGTTANTTATQNYGTTKEIANPTPPAGYAVTFNGNGATNPATQTSTKSFSKWTLSGAGSLSGTTYTYGAGAGTLTASYTNNSITLPTPSRTGYTFQGWYTAATGGTKVGNAGANYTPTAATTLYAQWTVNSYTIAFNGNGATSGSMSNLAMTYGTAKTLTTNAYTKTGYTFLGWSTSSTATSATYANSASVNNLTATNGATVTLYAIWRKTITVTYNANGGTGAPTAQSINVFNSTTSGSITLSGTKPTKTGYTFAGWATSASGAVTHNPSTAYTFSNSTTLYAIWTVNSYTLTINPGGGTWGGTTANTTATQNYGSTKTIANPTPPAGYAVNFNGNGATNPATQTSTKSFSKWSLSGAGSLSGTIYTYGAGAGALTASYTNNSITLPTPSRTGYTFQGWYTASSGGTKVGNAGAAYTPTAATTLYAQWKINTYTIVFNGNGATSGSMSNLAMTYGTAKTLTANAYAKTGYTFLGWSTSNSATSATYANSASVNNLTATNGATVTLYAIWRKTITVTYNANGGTGAPTAQSINIFNSTTSGSITLSGTKPTRTGYTFAGWATSSSGAVVYNAGTAYSFSSSITLYAKWTANTYTIVFNGNGSTSGTMANLSMTYDVAKNLTSNSFAKTGYTFLGWSTSSTATSATYSNAQSISNLSSTNGAKVTLYAIWRKTITITYNANGGSGAPGSQSINVFNNTTAGTITISSTKPTRSGYSFLGWSTSNSATSATYSAGTGYSFSSSITLYAVWKDTVVPNAASITIPSIGCVVNSFNATLTVSDNSGGVGIDTSATKYILSSQQSAYGINSTTWNSAASLGTTSKTLSLTQSTAGTYYLHVLSVDKHGNKTETVSSKIIIKKMDIKNITTSGYSVYLYQVPTTAKSVRIAVWTRKNGQDETEWIELTNQGNGIWYGNVYTKNHNFESGEYLTHAYIYSGEGGDPSTIIGGTYEYIGVSEDDTQKFENGITVPSCNVEIKNLTSSGYDIYIYNVPNGVSEVLFPTWSANNGPDDISWDIGTNQGNSTWYYRVNISKHNNEHGLYYTDIYARKSGNSQLYYLNNKNVTVP